MRFPTVIKLFLTLACLSTASEAQDESTPDDRKADRRAEIALIALGPKPPRTFKKGGNSSEPTMMLAQPGETPPARLYFRDKRGNGNESGWTAFNVAFNTPSSLRKIPADREMKLFRKLSGEDNFELYATLPAVPASMRRIFFLVPSKYGATPWKESPDLEVLTLENADLIDKNFILVNFSKHTVQHAFGDSVDSVVPDQIITYQLDKLGQLYRLAARYGSQKKIIYNTAVRLSPEGHTQLYVLYNGNPATNAGRDIGVFRMMIPVRQNGTPPGETAE